MILGNKSDLHSQRAVPTELAKKYASSIDAQLFETSAYSHQGHARFLRSYLFYFYSYGSCYVGVSEVFRGLCEELLRVARESRYQDRRRDALENQRTSVRLGESETQESKQCCS